MSAPGPGAAAPLSDPPAPGEAAEPLVEVMFEECGWAEALPDLAALADLAARAALEAEGRDPARWSLSLLACSDARIAGLNGAFRAKAQPTNVLSWPAFDPPPADGEAPSTQADAPRIHLGDLALALGTCRTEAETAGISLKDHAIHLILHGCLHLLGRDHATEDEAVIMEGIETRVLAGLGIEDPHSRGDARPAHPD